MKSVTLFQPLTYGEGTLDTITFRDPRAGDLRGLKLAGLSEVDVDLILVLTRRLSTQPLTDAQLWALAPADLLKVSEAVMGFFAPAEGTSPETSPASPTTPPAPGAS